MRVRQLFLLLLIQGVCYGQATRQHSVELYYPNYYFQENFKFRLIPLIPFNFGVAISSFNSDKNRSVYLAFDRHEFLGNNWSKKSLQPGLISQRYINFLSFGYIRPFVSKKNWELSWLYDFNLRVGGEYFWYGVYGGWEQKHYKRRLLDLGASIGARIKYKLPCNFYLSAELKQSVYYFRWYNTFEIYPDTPNWDVGTPISSLNFNFKLGYTIPNRK